jgi:hypothetical protein
MFPFRSLAVGGARLVSRGGSHRDAAIRMSSSQTLVPMATRWRRQRRSVRRRLLLCTESSSAS